MNQQKLSSQILNVLEQKLPRTTSYVSMIRISSLTWDTLYKQENAEIFYGT